MPAFDQFQFGRAIEGATQGQAALLLQHLALDADQVAFIESVHRHVASEDHGTAVLIFLGNRGIPNDPAAPVGMHEEQLPRELAVIGGGASLPMIPTGQIKRVANALLADPGRVDDGRRAADGGGHLLGLIRGGRNGRSGRTAAGVRRAAAIVATTMEQIQVTPFLLGARVTAVVLRSLAAHGLRSRAADRLGSRAADGLRGRAADRLGSRAADGLRGRAANGLGSLAAVLGGAAVAALVSMEQAMQPAAEVQTVFAAARITAAVAAGGSAATARAI